MPEPNPYKGRLRAALFALAVAAAGGAAPAWAHVVPMTADEMVRAARFVVVATVTDRHAQWNDRHNLILTRYTLSVEDGLRGTPPAALTVVVAGGTLDGETHASCMTVDLAVGRRYVLFVNDPAVPTFSTFTGAAAGVLAEVPATDGSEPSIASLGGAFAELTGGERVPFREFVDRLRAFIQTTERTPGPAPRVPVVHDPPLPAKTYEPASAAFPEGRRLVPQTPPAVSGPGEPEQPVMRHLDASSASLVPPKPDPGTDYAYSRAPGRYIVWNELPPSLAPWAPHDQYMMSRWNAYGDIHRVSGNPTGTWAWGDNRYDMTGWPSSQEMMNAFGQGWGPDELAICWARWFGSGPIVEADISMNPAFGWTLDNEWGTRSDNGDWSYEQSVLHELGHSWGLGHPWEVQDVWWDSVMNYSPKQFRAPVLFADDTNAIRAAYPGIGVHDGLISMYQTVDTVGANDATYLDSFPNEYSVQQGGSIHFNRSFKVENAGTDNIVDPRVDVYLTPRRMDWSGNVYLQSLYYSLTMAVYSTWTLDPGPVFVPYGTPPGDYWVALWLADPTDAYAYNNGAWGTRGNSTLTVTSYPWAIYPISYWQYQGVTLGPNGQYDFYFHGSQGQRYDLSTCPGDGAGAGFDTVLRVYDPNGALVGYSDDACGLQSRTSFEAPSEGQYHVTLRGFDADDCGWVTMGYRARTFPSSAVVLEIPFRDLAADSVVLSWFGDNGPYDLERATSPDFSDAVRLLDGTLATSYSDPVLSDGVTYFYRVR